MSVPRYSFTHGEPPTLYHYVDAADYDALAARCAAMTELVSMMEEYVSQPIEEVTPRWHWIDEKLKEVIARCKSPDADSGDGK